MARAVQHLESQGHGVQTTGSPYPQSPCVIPASPWWLGHGHQLELSLPQKQPHSLTSALSLQRDGEQDTEQSLVSAQPPRLCFLVICAVRLCAEWP